MLFKRVTSQEVCPSPKCQASNLQQSFHFVQLPYSLNTTGNIVQNDSLNEDVPERRLMLHHMKTPSSKQGIPGPQQRIIWRYLALCSACSTRLYLEETKIQRLYLENISFLFSQKVKFQRLVQFWFKTTMRPKLKWRRIMKPTAHEWFYL